MKNINTLEKYVLNEKSVIDLHKRYFTSLKGHKWHNCSTKTCTEDFALIHSLDDADSWSVKIGNDNFIAFIGEDGVRYVFEIWRNDKVVLTKEYPMNQKSLLASDVQLILNLQI